MMQTLLSAKGENDYTKYLYGWDSKTGFYAEHGDYYLLFPGIAKDFLKEMTGSEEIRVDYDKDLNLWFVTSDMEFVRMLENDVIELGTDPIKHSGEKKSNPVYVATRKRLVMD